jgi:hypothetical protein
MVTSTTEEVPHRKMLWEATGVSKPWDIKPIFLELHSIPQHQRPIEFQGRTL